MLLFDMDGTLLNSNGVWQEVDTAFLAKRGIPYTKDYYEGVGPHHLSAGGQIHQGVLPAP